MPRRRHEGRNPFRVFDPRRAFDPGRDINLPRAGQAHGLGHIPCRQATGQHPGAQPAATGQQPPVKGKAVAAGQGRPARRFRIDQKLIGF
jgi:hypothetical protein